MQSSIPLYRIFHDDYDKRAVDSVITSGTNWANGPQIAEFESNLMKYCGRKHCAALCNGTAALHSVLLAHGITSEDEVIVPSFTFISTANSVFFTGAKPIFADIEKKTLGLDAQSVKEKISERTKAIILVHFSGCPADQTLKIKEIADANGLILIEDNAESLGARLDGRLTGTFSDSQILSFCANKLITCGEGGAVLTDSENISKKLRLLRSHGREETENYFNSSKDMDYVSLGYNFRMPSMCAALADSQLSKIDDLIKMRKKVASEYRDSLKGLDISFLPDDDRYNNVHQLFSIILGDSKRRDGLRKHLQDNKISCKVYFDPIHKSIYYSKNMGYDDHLSVTEDMSSRILSLPMHPQLSTSEIYRISSTIKEFLG